MRLSRKGRFAVTAMMNLALNDSHGPMTLTQLTQDQGISLSYLEQIFARLRQEGLVNGVRGPGGGYCLSRSSTDITIADIIAVIDGKTAPPTAGIHSIYGGNKSASRAMWNELSADLYEYIDDISLADCVARHNQRITVPAETRPSDVAIAR